MKILALDSSTNVATVALCEDEKLLALYTVNGAGTHSKNLLPMIEQILVAFSLSASDIDLFAATAGPGSFTGVRIGAATLKGLAFDSGAPCVEVSTLHAIAEGLVLHEGLICAVMNARREQVYTALFESDGYVLRRLTPDRALSLSELDEELSAYGTPVAFCGDGYDLVEKSFKKTELYTVPSAQRIQSAAALARVAYKKYTEGEHTTDTAFAVNYLRPSQAERERMERENHVKNN